MINLSTPSKELLEELYSDNKKALFWLQKQIGGERKFFELVHLLQYKARKTGKMASSKTYEYISKNGNKWISSVSVAALKGKKNNIYQVNGFCYYETYGSIGAFVPLTYTNLNNRKACVIFTSHFFYQFCERAKIPFRSREMVMAFCRVMPTMVFNVSNDRGKTEVQCRLPGGVGFGVPRDKDSLVYEIRTYLTDEGLNKRQERVTKDLRRIGDNRENSLIGLSISAGQQSFDDVYLGLMNKEVEILKDIGFNGAENIASLLTSVWHLFATNGYVHQIDFAKYKEHIRINCGVVENVLKEKYTSDDDFYRRVIIGCAKNLKIKDVDVDKLMNHLNKVIETIKKK